VEFTGQVGFGFFAFLEFGLDLGDQVLEFSGSIAVIGAKDRLTRLGK